MEGKLWSRQFELIVQHFCLIIYFFLGSWELIIRTAPLTGLTKLVIECNSMLKQTILLLSDTTGSSIRASDVQYTGEH